MKNKLVLFSIFYLAVFSIFGQENAFIVNSCGDINVQNVTVTNGAKLTLDVAGTTTINGDFEVALGSELEIK